MAMQDVARRHPELDPTGVRLVIEPAEDESPILSLDSETIERIQVFADALDKLSGASDPVAIFGQKTIRELVAMLPEDEEMQETLSSDIDESDTSVQEQFAALLRND